MSSASISGTDRPPPDMPHATQVVPSLGLNGQPTTTPAPSEDNGGDTFPLAAIAILVIVLGIAGLVFAYKLYRWCYLRAQRAQAIEDFYGPDTRRSPGPGGFASLPSQISLGQGGGYDSMGRRSMSGFAGGGGVRNRQMSWGGDSWGGGGTMHGSKEGGDFSPPQQGSREASPGPYDASSRNSLAGFPSYSSRTSLGGPPPRRGIYSSSASGSQILSPTRTLSSFSSPYLGPSASFSSNSQQQFFPSGNRLAGAPHSIHSRIEVVPPSPLAPPPGQVIATDKSTLDFAPSSGIGRGNAVFGGGAAISAAAPTAVAPPIMASSSGSGASLGGNQNSDEWDLITGEEAQERLDPAFDATTPYSVAPSLSPIIPPSSSSSSSSSSGMSLTHARLQPAAATATAVPSTSPYHDPSFAAPTSSNAAAAAAPFAQNPDPSRPSPPRAGATRHPRLPSIDTGGAFVPPAVSRARAADVDDDDEGAGGPKSPLEKLQMQVERERKGLSLRQGLSQQGDEGYGH